MELQYACALMWCVEGRERAEASGSTALERHVPDITPECYTPDFTPNDLFITNDYI